MFVHPYIATIQLVISFNDLGISLAKLPGHILGNSRLILNDSEKVPGFAPQKITTRTWSPNISKFVSPMNNGSDRVWGSTPSI